MDGKRIKFISVPYDSAHFNERMGAGPRHIINKGLIPILKSPDIKVDHKEILLKENFPTEVASTFKLLSLLKTEIVIATEEQSFPVVVSGNCCATVAVMAGLNSSDVGVVWFDAHADCETPETTSSGFLDGMGMALLIKQCWSNLLFAHKLYTPLSSQHVCLIGARDLSAYEKDFISANGIHHVNVQEAKQPDCQAVKAACLKLTQSGVKRLHLHFDADVIDPLIATANSYAAGNGLNKEDVAGIINFLISGFRITSLTIASYDPSFDNDDKMLRIIQELVALVLNQVRQNEPAT